MNRQVVPFGLLFKTTLGNGVTYDEASFKGSFGIADLTEEQIERMTLGEFVDTINAELLKGGEFGTKKRTPPTKKSIRRFDEDAGSGSNGLLRWKNDRGPEKQAF